MDARGLAPSATARQLERGAGQWVSERGGALCRVVVLWWRGGRAAGILWESAVRRDHVTDQPLNMDSVVPVVPGSAGSAQQRR